MQPTFSVQRKFISWVYQHVKTVSMSFRVDELNKEFFSSKHCTLYELTATNWGVGGAVVVHVSLTTVTRVRFWLRVVIWLKLPWSHVRRVLSSLTLPIIAGFLRVLRFPPVVTLDPWRVALTGPLGRTAQVAGRVIRYKQRHFTLIET